VTSRFDRAFALVVLLASSVAQAAPTETPEVQKARAEFVVATAHVKEAQWGEALAAFERSSALRPHALTTYNIGACERALGRYTRARQTLKKATEATEAAGGSELPRSFADEARRWMREIEGLLVRASVTLAPDDAALLVDGAPLVRDGDVLVAGLPAGEHPVTTPGTHFTLLVDPGTHILALSRPGFANAVVTKTFAPGTSPKLALDLQSLPATIFVATNVSGAVVSVDELDTGVAPVQISRPAGTYNIAVRKKGFVPYVTTVRVNAGDAPSLQARLTQETTPVYKKLWFWSLAAVVVAGATVGTYLVARPEPERPAPDGGGIGWVVGSFRFPRRAHDERAAIRAAARCASLSVMRRIERFGSSARSVVSMMGESVKTPPPRAIGSGPPRCFVIKCAMRASSRPASSRIARAWVSCEAAATATASVPMRPRLASKPPS
jgi:hypothetical protein